MTRYLLSKYTPNVMSTARKDVPTGMITSQILTKRSSQDHTMSERSAFRKSYNMSERITEDKVRDILKANLKKYPEVVIASQKPAKQRTTKLSKHASKKDLGGGGSSKNALYFGDNLDILKKYIINETIDLIYLDPPFNSNADYNIIFKNKDGKKSPAQIMAFTDTWEWDIESEATMDFLRNTRIGGTISGLEQSIGHNDLFAYVVMMAIRLLELHRILKKTGSIYVHCDPTASHYLKIVMDAIFDPKNFKNEIIWKRATSGQKGSQYASKKFGRNHDIILFYGKDTTLTKFYPPKRPLTAAEVDKKFNKVDPDGRRWMDDSSHIWRTPGMGARPNLCYDWKGFKNPHPSGWRLKKERLEEEYQKGNFEIIEKPDGTKKLIRKVYEENYKGENIGDLWDDIPPAQGAERVGYPTQKPEKLLERIIKASSVKGDFILDPFCGCGTTVMESERLHRTWIGIDITPLAVNMIGKRVYDKFKVRPEIHGIPNTVESAKILADQNKFQFETWAISLIPNIHPNQRQVGDKGIDGRGQISVIDSQGKRKHEMIIVSVKGGQNIVPGMVRDLIGTIKSQRATFGIFICLKKPTKKTIQAADEAGVYHTEYGHYPRVQIYTIEEYFQGIRPKIMSILDTTRVSMQKREPHGTQTTF